MKQFYQLKPEECIELMETNKNGLTQAEVEVRIQKYGWNELSEKRKNSPIQIILSQLNDFLVWILLAGALLSILIGKWESSLVIFLVIIVNALLGTVQHIKAERSLDSLKKMSAPMSRILRDGIKIEIPTRGIVPGDLILIEAGDYISADGRLTEVYGLQVNESSLTGESESVHKQIEPLAHTEAPMGDRINMVHAGSYVTYGRGVAVVTSTGMSTEIGRIADLLKSTEEKKTPLQISLDQFGHKLALFILGISALLLVLSALRGQPMLNALMFTISLAIAAIPEALSAIVTIVLAIGTQKMSKENAIIRQLHAVESLGCISVICSDKTGTLTQNKMTVQKVFLNNQQISVDELSTSDALERKLIYMAILCNDAVTHEQLEVGDPTEVALVKIGDALGIDENELRKTHRRVQELPFDSTRKIMSTLNQMDGQLLLLTKGAIDGLLTRMTHYETESGIAPINQEILTRIEAAHHQFSTDGLRVLAFAYKTVDQQRTLTFDDESNLIFMGLIAMMDPPRLESADAVAACIQAGIRPVMITGDHKVTATAIAKQIGMLKEGDTVLEGTDVEAMTDDTLRQKVSEVTIYARVSPEHKIRIVKAWQANGHVVAMTGDGVNDAPAIRQADIGIAMGITGTEVSKDASAVVLADDNFSTIVKAISAGRNIYNNIQSSILFLLSGNTAGILTVLYTSIMNLPLPFAPVHLLFINLVTDSLPAIAIGAENHMPDVMKEKVRKISEPFLNKQIGMEVLIKGLIISAATLGAYWYGLKYGGAGVAQTMAFATFCLGKLFHGFDSRSQMPLIKQGIFTNMWLWVAVLVGMALLHIVLYVPIFHQLFEITPLTYQELGVIYSMSLIPLILIEIMKTYKASSKK